jgi:hypothetical protein
MTSGRFLISRGMAAETLGAKLTVFSRTPARYNLNYVYVDVYSCYWSTLAIGENALLLWVYMGDR